MIKKLISLLNQLAYHKNAECCLKKCNEDDYSIVIRYVDHTIYEHYFDMNLFTDRDREKEPFYDKELNDERESNSNKELIYALYWLNQYCFIKNDKPIERVDFSSLCHLLDKFKTPNRYFEIHLKPDNSITGIEVTFRTKSNFWPAKFEYSNKGVKDACDFMSIMYSKSHTND